MLRGPNQPGRNVHRRRARGFTLIETALATVIIGVGVVAIVEAHQAFMRPGRVVLRKPEGQRRDE